MTTQPSQKSPKAGKRVKTPTLIQMEAVECGAAALGMILAYFGRIVPLEELRVECGVSRDGSKASNMLRAARKYGLECKGYRYDPHEVKQEEMPVIVFWNFNHFVVVEGFGKGKVYLNDPASGPRVVTEEEFDLAFTGVTLTFKATPAFEKGGTRPSIIQALRKRLIGSEVGLLYVFLLSLALVIPGLVVPTFTLIFVDDILISKRDIMDQLLLMMTVAIIAIGGLNWFQRYYLLRMETKLALNNSSKFFWHILRLPMQFFNQRSPGEVSNRVSINDRVAQLLAGQLAITLLGVVLIVFYALLMIQYDVILTFISVSIALINILALRYFSRQRRDATKRLRQEEGKLMGTAMGGLTIIETLKASGNESSFFSQWAGLHAKAVNAEQELGLPSQIFSVIPPLLISLNTATILVVGSVRVMDGALTFGMLTAFQALMGRFLAPVNDLVNLGTQLQEVEADMNRLDDVLRHGRDTQADRDMAVEEGFEIKLSGHLELRNICFGYSRLAPPLIENFNMTLRPGERIALVGGSGSGKSTIAKLVAGLYEPWEGEILFDGKPRSENARTTLTNSLSVVDQEIFMFEGSIKENITMWDNTIPAQRVAQAAKDAAIHEDIAALKGGYDYYVEEGGRNFSGGQRQRLEIARALVNDPVLLILDEATSALDPVTEKRIEESLRRRGCACLIVAHRLSTIRDADEIIVLERGKVVQRGTHETLIKTKGAYTNLIKSEAPQQNRSVLQSIFDKLG